MAAATKKSVLAAKVGNRLNNAFKKSAEGEIDWGFQSLPPGITGGVARLKECRFEVIPAGKENGAPPGSVRLRMMGVMVAPKTVEVRGQSCQVKGLQTWRFETVADTKGKRDGKDVTISQAEHAETVINLLRQLGAQFSENPTAEEVEQAAADLENEKPYFRITTRESEETLNPDGSVKYKARVWETWGGIRGLEDYEEVDDDNGGVVDETPTAQAAAPSKNGTPKNPAAAPTEDISTLTELDRLVEIAEGPAGIEEAAAVARIIELGVEAGLTKEQVEAADDWPSAKALIEEAQAGGGDAGDDAQQEFTVEKGNVYKFTPRDAKGNPLKGTNKKPLPAADCEVMAVNASKKTATLKNMEDGKTQYKDVSWEWIKADNPF